MNDSIRDAVKALRKARRDFVLLPSVDNRARMDTAVDAHRAALVDAVLDPPPQRGHQRVILKRENRKPRPGSAKAHWHKPNRCVWDLSVPFERDRRKH